ncbi:MAG: CDGSH iron-sulfur domain-containing protein [Candidatus Eremiobacteraeota bacterium]|nr:CDGSH iron-sulfur domain-containing protein [Candidatus Eremiobacteraeota bacterium]
MSNLKDSTALCRCGHSKNKPFCDGTHKTAGFSSEVKAV